MSGVFEHEILLKPFPLNAQRLVLVRRADKIGGVCRELLSMNITHTLVRGDFHMSNIKCDSGNDRLDQVQFIDWTSSCIAHPFYDYL